MAHPFTAPEYRAAVSTLTEAPAQRPRRHPWDPALAVALAECGVRAEEETVLNDLDLVMRVLVHHLARYRDAGLPRDPVR